MRRENLVAIYLELGDGWRGKPHPPLPIGYSAAQERPALYGLVANSPRERNGRNLSYNYAQTR